MTSWLWLLVVGAFVVWMFRSSHGGGCCGGHSGHGSHSGSDGHHHGAGPNPPRHDSNSTATIQDPVCGMFVSPHDAIKREIKGQVFYFCSEKCATTFERK